MRAARIFSHTSTAGSGGRGWQSNEPPLMTTRVMPACAARGSMNVQAYHDHTLYLGSGAASSASPSVLRQRRRAGTFAAASAGSVRDGANRIPHPDRFFDLPQRAHAPPPCPMDSAWPGPSTDGPTTCIGRTRKVRLQALRVRRRSNSHCSFLDRATTMAPHARPEIHMKRIATPARRGESGSALKLPTLESTRSRGAHPNRGDS
jgi:hypothetical protein